MKENVDLTENRDFRLKAKEYYRGAIPVNMFSIFNNYNILIPSELYEHDRFGILLESYYINKDSGAIVKTIF